MLIGSRLGSYEVLAKLGEGGMGEVYRARDTKLHRDVALKLLPASFADDADRLARFDREAKTLASLNHPHIAQIYGLEESSGVRALVMELVEGEDLAQRIARGPIALDEALGIATQIADALEAAHEQGIIHRDLKPANIKIRPDGGVKVLDFGLAKIGEASGGGRASADDLANSPTFTVAATQVGIIVGTAGYMAPEQARGKAIDKRTDIWAFGCVLYEMLTGTPPFEGETVTDVLAAIVEREPEWTALPPGTPPHVRRVLERCLQKDRRNRLRDIGDARLELEAGVREPKASSSLASSHRRGRVVWTALACVAFSAAAAGSTWLLTRPTPPRVVRTAIVTPEGASLSLSRVGRNLIITPDGDRVVYVGNRQLFVRSLDRFEVTDIPIATEGRAPFSSPDGRWIGFFDDVSGLRRVPIGGGPAMPIAPTEGAARGATWGADDTVVFATDAPTGLLRVPAGGGEPVVLTTPDQGRGEADHVWPEFVPGRDAVLYTIKQAGGAADSGQIAILDLRTGTSKVILTGGSHAQYLSTGHLVYAASGRLLAAPFDLDTLQAGTPVPVLDEVTVSPYGAVALSVSRTGTAVYVPRRGMAGGERALVWVDRAGREEPIAAPVRLYAYPRISPDGTRAAIDIRDQENDLWMWDFSRQTLTRLTTHSALDIYPVWSRDGRRVLFGSQRSGVVENLFWQSADGTGTVERLTESTNQQAPFAVTGDGRSAIARERSPRTGFDLMLVPLEPPYEPKPLIVTEFHEVNGEPSPDGRWLAYQSNASGQFDVYVRPLPDVNAGRWQVSTAGGRFPVWSRDGSELFYVASDDTVMSVRVQPGSGWQATTPAKLFRRQDLFFGTEETATRTFDVGPDGRFLMIRNLQHDVPRQVHVVQNWFAELKRLVSGK
jgi:eukaryotic-like serine/threonine-protein kinase